MVFPCNTLKSLTSIFPNLIFILMVFYPAVGKSFDNLTFQFFEDSPAFMMTIHENAMEILGDESLLGEIEKRLHGKIREVFQIGADLETIRNLLLEVKNSRPNFLEITVRLVGSELEFETLSKKASTQVFTTRDGSTDWGDVSDLLQEFGIF